MISRSVSDNDDEFFLSFCPPGSANIDKEHEFSALNRANNDSPGYRRCVGLHKPSSDASWNFSVENCTKAISYTHGYFCEYSE